MQVEVNFNASPRLPGTAATAARTRTAASPDPWLPIGQVAQRAGVAASALRYYEAQGLIAGSRSAGGQRLYPRHVLRRIAFVRAAQTVGLTLAEIQASLATLPDGRTPNKADWQRLARDWQPRIDARIAELVRLRERLASCIGCGCLSLKSCALYNPRDGAARSGSGARFVLAERDDSDPSAG